MFDSESALTHSFTSLVMPDHRFHQCHHCHRLSPLPSFTPESKHIFTTNYFHHSSPMIDLPRTDFAVTWPAHWFFLAKRGRLSRNWSAFERAIEILFLFIHARPNCDMSLCSFGQQLNVRQCPQLNCSVFI